MKTIELGVIELGSKVIVTDPCYGFGGVELIHTKKGKYHCFAYEINESGWGNRIAALRVVHEDFVNKCFNIDYDNEIAVSGVDSGQCGFFDYDYYKKHHGQYIVDDEMDEDWYHKVCNITCNNPCAGTIDNKAVVSESGYGDGCYAAFGAYDGEELIAMELCYILDED